MGCGCSERKEIMFTQGDLGRTEMLIIALSLAAVIYAWRVK